MPWACRDPLREARTKARRRGQPAPARACRTPRTGPYVPRRHGRMPCSAPPWMALRAWGRKGARRRRHGNHAGMAAPAPKPGRLEGPKRRAAGVHRPATARCRQGRLRARGPSHGSCQRPAPRASGTRDRRHMRALRGQAYGPSPPRSPPPGGGARPTARGRSAASRRPGTPRRAGGRWSMTWPVRRRRACCRWLRRRSATRRRPAR